MINNFGYTAILQDRFGGRISVSPSLLNECVRERVFEIFHADFLNLAYDEDVKSRNLSPEFFCYLMSQEEILSVYENDILPQNFYKGHLNTLGSFSRVFEKNRYEYSSFLVPRQKNEKNVRAFNLLGTNRFELMSAMLYSDSPFHR